MSRHLFARAGIASLVGLLGMSLGCDKAPSGPTSTAAPAVTAVSPNTGLTVRSVSPAAGLIGRADEGCWRWLPVWRNPDSGWRSGESHQRHKHGHHSHDASPCTRNGGPGRDQP